MTARLYKVYCYRGREKQIWYEVEDCSTGQGIAWSPARATVLKKAEKLGYEVVLPAVLKFYRAKAV